MYNVSVVDLFQNNTVYTSDGTSNIKIDMSAKPLEHLKSFMSANQSRMV